MGLPIARPLIVANWPVREPKVSAGKLFPMAGLKPFTRARLSIPSSVAAPDVVNRPNWLVAVPPMSMATVPFALLLNPPLTDTRPLTPVWIVPALGPGLVRLSVPAFTIAEPALLKATPLALTKKLVVPVPVLMKVPALLKALVPLATVLFP